MSQMRTATSAIASMMARTDGGWSAMIIAPSGALSRQAYRAAAEAAVEAQAGRGRHGLLKIVEPNEKGRIAVDAIREISDYNSLSSGGGVKTVLVLAAERMNQQAANALLKSLEEPGENARIILISSDPSTLPATIRSRCLVERTRSSGRAQAADAQAGRVTPGGVGDGGGQSRDQPPAAAQTETLLWLLTGEDPDEFADHAAADMTEKLAQAIAVNGNAATLAASWDAVTCSRIAKLLARLLCGVATMKLGVKAPPAIEIAGARYVAAPLAALIAQIDRLDAARPLLAAPGANAKALTALLLADTAALTQGASQGASQGAKQGLAQGLAQGASPVIGAAR